MTTIIATNMRSAEAVTPTVVTLTGTDDFVYTKGRRAILVLDNVTAGALAPVIDGDGGTTVPVSGVGSVSVSGGYAVPSIAAGAKAIIPLDAKAEYLTGTIAVSGGVGIKAMLLEF